MKLNGKDIEACATNYGSALGFPLKGAAHKGLGSAAKPRKASPVNLILGVVVPWVIFFATFYIWGFNVRYWAGPVALILVLVLLVVCLATLGALVQSIRGKLAFSDPYWLGLLCILSFVAYFWAFYVGSNVFQNYIQPYYDVQQLNVYRSVNPSTSEGNQFMDFGILQFVPNAAIDRVFSMAFKNEDVYCVAPVRVNDTKMATYDFWAVGTNCCSQHLSDFRCGEWNNPGAKSGVRVASESQRQFYQLAAKQAAAAFDIPVKHPVFFEWISDPADHINASQDDAFASLGLQSFWFFVVEVVLVFLASWVFP